MVQFLNYISIICNCNRFTVQCCFLISILVSIFVLFGAIVFSVIYVIATLGSEPAKVYVGEIENGEAIDLNFNINNCPRMNTFPFENVYSILQLNLRTDSESSESLLLHYYAGKDNNDIYTNLLSTCASTPGSVCALRFPVFHSRFFAVVVPSTITTRNNSIQFTWDCDFWIQPAQVSSLSLLIISLILLLIFLLIYFSCLSIRCAKYLEEKREHFQSQKGYNTNTIAMEFREELAFPEYPSATPFVESISAENQIKYV